MLCQLEEGGRLEPNKTTGNKRVGHFQYSPSTEKGQGGEIGMAEFLLLNTHLATDGQLYRYFILGDHTFSVQSLYLFFRSLELVI